MRLPWPGGVRTSEGTAATTNPGYPALHTYDGAGSVLSGLRWRARNTQKPLKPNPPALHVHTSSPSFTDGLTQHQARQRSMTSRARAATVAERPGITGGRGFGQDPKLSHYRKSLSRDDTAWTMGGRQHEEPLATRAFDKRMSRDDMSIAHKSNGMYSGTKTFDNKRMSRDDMALPTRQFDRANYKSYHIPIRGRLPSPDSSPSHELSHGVTTVRVPTPESMDDNGSTGVIAIGMALGSPAHPPWGQPQQAVTMHNGPSASTLDLHEPQEETQAKAKSRKWGFFGRSKSKRERAPDVNLQPPISEIPRVLPSPNLISPAIPTPSTAQSVGTLQEEPKRRKSLRRKTLVSREQKPPVPEIRTEQRPMPASIDVVSASKLQSPGGPLLDVEIPSVEMERYSIMFGNVLNPPSTSALLARRHATLDRVKTLKNETASLAKEAGQQKGTNGLVADEWPRARRATSPQPTRTPSFTIFPSTSDRSSEIRGLSPNMRSNTSPALLPSPSHESSPERAVSRQRAVSKPTPLREPERPDAALRSTVVNKSQQPRLVSKFNKQSPKLSSPDTVEASPAFVFSPVQIRESLDTQSDAEFSPKHVVSPVQADAEKEKALQDAVEISIARQISVSRQQRSMLKPVQGSIRGRKDVSPNGVGMTTRVTVGRKGSTPTLVHLEEDDSATRAMHRKSSRGIVEAMVPSHGI